MAPSIQVFVQVVLLCCVVTTSMGGFTDWQNEFSQLENKIMVQQEEIKSLHQIIKHLEKRLEQLEVKGEFDEVRIQPADSIFQSLLVGTIFLLKNKFLSLLHCMISSHISKWQESKLLKRDM